MEEASRHPSLSEQESKLFDELVDGYSQRAVFAPDVEQVDEPATSPLPPIGAIEECIPRTRAERERLEAYEPVICEAPYTRRLNQL